MTNAIAGSWKVKVMEKRMLSVRELSHYIGIAEQTIKNKLYAGDFPIPPKKIGRRVLWDKKTVDNYLEKLPEIEY